MRGTGDLRMTAARVFWFAAALVMLAGCHNKDEGRITGTATYRERIGLPAGVIFEADLIELGPTEADRRVIASETQENAGPVPIRFAITYPRAALDPSRLHAVDARLRVGGRVLFETKTPAPVSVAEKPEPIEILLTRAGPAGDLAGLEAEVAAIDARSAMLRRVEGTFKEGDISGSFVGYLDGERPVLILEGRDLGQLGSSSIAYHFRDGTLLRYAEDTLRHAANDPTGERVSVSLKLYFDDNRYVGGTKLVDNVNDEPDQHEITEAGRRATLALSRLGGALAKRPAGTNVMTLACPDGATFRVISDPSAGNVRIERLGRDPVLLPRLKSASGTLYGDSMRSLFSSGDKFVWTAGDTPAVTCKRAPSDAALSLAPGQFPIADPEQSPAGAWERKLLQLMPAINTCLAHGALDLPRVTGAAPVAGGQVSVSLMSVSGGRVACVATVDGAKITSYVTSSSRAGEPADQKLAIFTPASSAYPESACYVHQRVMNADGQFLGWLSDSRC